MNDKDKTPVTGGMWVKTYVVLERAIEEGYKRGWMRAHKHVDNPSVEQIEDAVVGAIMGEICEIFTFPDIER